MINSTPLVTIAVVTYNSSQTILETLESVKEQTYKNIELIISDDCSSDNTSGFKKMPFFFKRANYLNILLIQELQKIVIEHTENQMENG